MHANDNAENKWLDGEDNAEDDNGTDKDDNDSVKSEDEETEEGEGHGQRQRITINRRRAHGQECRRGRGQRRGKCGADNANDKNDQDDNVNDGTKGDEEDGGEGDTYDTERANRKQVTRTATRMRAASETERAAMPTKDTRAPALTERTMRTKTV